MLLLCYNCSAEAVQQQQSTPQPKSGQLLVRFATPTETIINDKPIHMISIPAVTGVMGILADHSPTIAQLKPGVIQVYTNDLNDITHKYFVSGGFAVVKNDSTAAITVVEAIKIDDIDLNAAKKGIEDSIAMINRTTDEKQKVEAQIQQEVYEAIVNAVEGK